MDISSFPHVAVDSSPVSSQELQDSQDPPASIEIPLPSRPAPYRPGDGPPLAPIAVALQHDTDAFIVDKRVLPGKPVHGELKLELYYVVGWPDLPAARVSVLATEILNYVSPWALEDWEYKQSLERDKEEEEEERRQMARRMKQEKRARINHAPLPVAAIGAGAVTAGLSDLKKRKKLSRAEMIALKIAEQASVGEEDLANVPVPHTAITGPSLSTPRKGLGNITSDVGDSDTEVGNAIARQLCQDSQDESDHQAAADSEMPGLPRNARIRKDYTSLDCFVPKDSPQTPADPLTAPSQSASTSRISRPRSKAAKTILDDSAEDYPRYRSSRPDVLIKLPVLPLKAPPSALSAPALKHLRPGRPRLSGSPRAAKATRQSKALQQSDALQEPSDSQESSVWQEPSALQESNGWQEEPDEDPGMFGESSGLQESSTLQGYSAWPEASVSNQIGESQQPDGVSERPHPVSRTPIPAPTLPVSSATPAPHRSGFTPIAPFSSSQSQPKVPKVTPVPVPSYAYSRPEQSNTQGSSCQSAQQMSTTAISPPQPFTAINGTSQTPHRSGFTPIQVQLPLSSTKFPSPVPQPPPPSTTRKRKRPEPEPEQEYEIKRLEDDRVIETGGELVRFFKVRWEGNWPKDQNPTWEPEANIPVEAVQKYLQNRPKTAHRGPGGRGSVPQIPPPEPARKYNSVYEAVLGDLEDLDDDIDLV